MNNQIRQRAGEGKPSLGTFYEMGGTMAAECVGIGGMDFLIVDTEHGPFEAETALSAILAAERRGCVPFVRARDLSRPATLKLLDVGAMGVIVPDVRTVEEVCILSILRASIMCIILFTGLLSAAGEKFRRCFLP